MRSTSSGLKIMALFALLSINSMVAFSQSGLSQTVRGQIVDAETKQPLVFATIMVEGTSPVIGTTARHDGTFRLEGVPVGRHNLKVSYVGYEPFTVTELMVGSGKEVVLHVELKASASTLDKMVITANTNKDRPVNSMATVSARTFSVEETSRYAGGLDDPARLASAFAGVATTQTTNNAIIIRGNSPRGVLWRIEGVDVPAAFHFPNVDFVGGGGYTVLSNQMLRNSDFYTGAFPAEFGNASSGVFDIKMRSGNAEKREFTAGIGTSGIDFSAEGPLAKGKRATYLFNYRYSTLALLAKLTNFPNLPTFQDLTFKFDFPTKNYGTFSFWAMGAIDANKKEADADTLNWKTDYDRTGQDYFNRFGAIGLSHRISLGTKTFVHSTLSADGMRYGMNKKEYTFDLQLLPTDHIRSTEGKYTFRSTLSHKFSSRLSSRSGVTLNHLFFDNRLDKAFRHNPGEMITFVDNSGTGFSAQAFTQFKIDLLQNLSANIGFHSMYLNVNDKATLEPRAGLSWFVTKNDELSIAYGLHSQMEELRTYFSQTTTNDWIEMPNKNLDFMKSHHIVLGYSKKLSGAMRLKVEPYYQILVDVPVYANSSFSIINITSNWAINRKLENTGTGKNYGIDLTVERFLKDGYYYLFTATLFDSKYVGGDGKEYNTTFNRGHVVNLLAGKEWMIRDKNVLGVSAKVTYMGGLRYTPALYEESIAAQMYKPDNSQAFVRQFPPSTGVDLSITYRVNKPNYSGMWYFMIKNALLQPDYGDPFYDFISKDIVIDKMKMPFPSVGFKIEF
jgi:hypothetical protein